MDGFDQRVSYTLCRRSPIDSTRLEPFATRCAVSAWVPGVLQLGPGVFANPFEPLRKPPGTGESRAMALHVGHCLDPVSSCGCRVRCTENIAPEMVRCYGTLDLSGAVFKEWKM